MDKIAKKYWKLAGVDNKVDLHLAPAIETLEKLIEDGQDLHTISHSLMLIK